MSETPQFSPSPVNIATQMQPAFDAAKKIEGMNPVLYGAPNRVIEEARSPISPDSVSVGRSVNRGEIERVDARSEVQTPLGTVVRYGYSEENNFRKIIGAETKLYDDTGREIAKSNSDVPEAVSLAAKIATNRVVAKVEEYNSSRAA